MKNTYVRDRVSQGAIAALRNAHQAAGFPPAAEFASIVLAGNASSVVPSRFPRTETAMNDHLRSKAEWLLKEGYDIVAVLTTA